MKKFILQKAEQNLEENRMLWAQNHFVAWYQSQFDTNEAKVQVEAAKKNMEKYQDVIDSLEKYIKENK